MSDRTYGQAALGDGNYGGVLPAWDTLQGPVGPTGDADLAWRRRVSARLTPGVNWLVEYPGFGQGTAFRDRQGVCSINTTLQLTVGTIAAGAVPATLPAGFWPLNRVMVAGQGGNPMSGYRIDINTDGTVQVNSSVPAGQTYVCFDAVWYSVVPASYVINGCQPLRMLRGAGASYTLFWSAGRYKEALPGVTPTPGSSDSGAGHATAGNWNLVCLFQGGLIFLNTNPAGAAMPSESSALQNYNLNCQSGQQWEDYALLATFPSTGAGVVPAFNDRRWLPYAET